MGWEFDELTFFAQLKQKSGPFLGEKSLRGLPEVVWKMGEIHPGKK